MLFHLDYVYYMNTILIDRMRSEKWQTETCAAIIIFQWVGCTFSQFNRFIDAASMDFVQEKVNMEIYAAHNLYRIRYIFLSKSLEAHRQTMA